MAKRLTNCRGGKGEQDLPLRPAVHAGSGTPGKDPGKGRRTESGGEELMIGISNCMCSKRGILVRSGARKMVSCPDPMNCSGNFRTTWRAKEEEAIDEWNALIRAAKYAGGK